MKHNHEELNDILEKYGFIYDEFSYIETTDGLICHVEYNSDEIWKNGSYELSLDDFIILSKQIKKIEKELTLKKIEYKDFIFLFKNNKENKPSLFIKLLII